MSPSLFLYHQLYPPPFLPSEVLPSPNVPLFHGSSFGVSVIPILIKLLPSQTHKDCIKSEVGYVDEGFLEANVDELNIYE